MSKHHHTNPVPTLPHAKHHTVTLKAPGAKSVVVTGCFSGWSPEGHPLRHDGHGNWTGAISVQPGRYEYRFVVDGEWRDDPNCGVRVPNGFGTENCVFEV